MKVEPDRGNASVVLVGSFNPSIFSPDWLVHRGVVSAAAAETASVELIHREMCIIVFEDFRFRCDVTRFVAETEKEPFSKILDFTSKIFGEFLTHTPVEKFGINRGVHVDLHTLDKRDAFGRCLAPRKPWGSLAESIERTKGARKGGLLTMVMQLVEDDDRPAGHTRVKVDPFIPLTQV